MSLMSEKMQQSSVQGTNYNDPTTPALRSLVSDIMDLYEAPGFTKDELERLLSRTMRQGGDCAFSKQRLPTSQKWNTGNQINVTESRSLLLQFLNDISQTVFTGTPIKGEDCRHLMVALVDGHSGEVVTFGPEASANLDIVVLEADSGVCLGENWTPEEFKRKIVTQEGNRRLLTGNVVLHLNEGIGFVDIVRFSHTKIWKRKRAYRLGAIARDDYMRTKIKEGFTKSFFVKDHRLDLNKKHYPPALSDEVWRLDGIAKDGAFHLRLRDEKVSINTVEDLLKKLNTDSPKLRDILGKGMSAKMWERVVNHARTCKLDEKLYLYSSLGSQQKTSVVFDVIGHVKGLLWEFKYVSFEMLSESRKVHATNLVVSAFQQWDKVVSFDNEASLFDNYWKPINVVNHLTSPITKGSSCTKILISPKDDELHLPQPAVCLPKSPIKESSSGTQILISQKDYDDAVVLFGESSIICPPKSLIQESFSSREVLISPDIGEFGFSQLVVPSQEIIPTCDSVWDMNYHNDYNWQSIDSTGHSHESRLSYSKEMTDSNSWYQNMQALDKGKQPLTSGRDFAIPTSYETKDLQIFSSNAPVLSRNLSMKSEASLHSTVNDIMLARSITVPTNVTSRRYMSKREKARRRWTKLYSVMKWFSVQRDVTNRAFSALTLRDSSDSSFLNNLSDIWAMDSSSYDNFLSSWDMCLNQQTPMSFSSSFHEDK